MEQRKSEITESTKQSKRREEVNVIISRDSMIQGYGYFERVKLFLSLIKLTKFVI
ncbi:conserved hypothetical protein, partial [Trichinella spiralis]|uniref:hypothetical protein n=1 Tax=Trichinella spiralis TaxID=6334 RepID=UPI0001EFB439